MAHVYKKLQATEFGRLPERVQAVYLAPPVLSAPVAPDADGFRLISPASLDQPAPRALVPRLGLKSWRDAGALGVIYEGVNIRLMVERLLMRPTLAQRLAARAWTDTGLPLHVHLSPYVDFSDLSEVRFLAHPEHCHRLSLCQRGRSAQGLAAALPRMMSFAKAVAALLPLRSHVLDVGYLVTGISGSWT